MTLPDTAAETHETEPAVMPAGPGRPYAKPSITTYADDDLLELIGPASACSPAPGYDHHEWHCRRHGRGR